MDIFIEELIKKRKDTKDYVILAFLILVGLILSVCFLMGILFGAAMLGQWGQIAGSVGMLLVAAIWYGVYFINNSRSVEYEYIVVNNNLDIDKIMAKKRRKKMLELDIKDVSLMACTEDAANNSVYKNIDKSVNVLDLSAKNSNMYTYFIDYTTEGKRQIVLFQPTTKMVEALWKYNPRNVKKYNI